jgi:hypothetical protein
MMLSKQRGGLVSIVLATIAALWLAACGGAPPSDESGRLGSISAALMTTGSDGSVYRFPSGTLLSLSTPTYLGQFPLDLEENTLNVTVPATLLSVYVSFPGGVSQLERTAGGVTSVVNADWTDPPPQAVNVVEGTTQSLILHFAVRGLGDVEFSMGQLAVSLEVTRNETDAPSGVFATGGYANSGVLFGPSASPEVHAQLGMAPGETHGYNMAFNVTGPWVQYSADEVCAPTLFDSFATGAEGESAFSRAVREVSGGDGVVCVKDTGAVDQIRVNAQHVGTAIPDQQSFLPGNNYRFFLHVGGNIADVYDGTTLAQSKLEALTTLESGTIQHQIWDYSVNQEVLFSYGNITGGIRLVP